MTAAHAGRRGSRERAAQCLVPTPSTPPPGGWSALAPAGGLGGLRARRRARRPARRARGPGGCGRTWPGWSRPPPRPSSTSWCGPALRSYARYWCEAFRLPRMDRPRSPVAWTRTVRGAEPVRSARCAPGRGVVFALPHSGNWDVAGVWLVETLRRHRSRAVVHHGGRSGCARVAVPPVRGLPGGAGLRGGRGRRRAGRAPGADPRLRAGGVVCLLADRDLSGSGTEVDFFGEPARFPTGPALLAGADRRRCSSRCYPGSPPDGWSVRLADPVPVGRPRRRPGGHPGDGRRVRRAHRRGARRLARAAADLGGRPARGRWPVTEPRLRVGHGVPVLAGRARRGAVARGRAGRGAARGRAPGERARAGRRGHPAARVRDRRPGGRCGCPTTGRWPGWRSGRCPTRGPGAGSPSTSSTCCTCTSRPR